MMTASRKLSVVVLLLALFVAPPVLSQVNTGSIGIDATEQAFRFDIEATKNIVVDDFDVIGSTPISPNLGFLSNYEVWTTKDGGSYVGREDKPAQWQLVGTATGILGLGPGFWSPLGLSLNVLVPAGTKRGFILTSPDFEFIRGFSATAVGLPFASNADLTIRSGTASDYFDIGYPAIPAVNVHYSVSGPFVLDICSHSILAPVPDPQFCQQLSSLEHVVVEFMNLGTTNLLPGAIVSVTLVVDDGAPVTEFAVLSQTVLPSEKFSYTFTSFSDFGAIGPHSVVVTAVLVGDQEQGNDTLTATIRSGGELRVVSFPYIEDFESLNRTNLIVPPFGWTQEVTDSTGKGSEWFFATPGLRPGMPGDHTVGDGQWASLIDLDSQQPIVSLRSPCLDFTNLTSPKLSFWLSILFTAGQPNTNLLSIDVLNMQTGVLTSDVFGPWIDNIYTGWPNEVDNGWFRHDVDLSAFAGQIVRLVFRGSTDHGGFVTANTHDFNIDDIWVYDFLPPLGQPQQPGFATFKIGETRNANFDLLEGGFGGPFFSKVKANESMVLEFSGEPNMPVMVLGGVLNPLAAVYPFIGQLDIGGAVDPLSGIPTGIVVLADGNLTDGLNPLFNTAISGDGIFGVILPNIPPGLLTTFQCAILTTGANGSWVALSNAIQVTVE